MRALENEKLIEQLNWRYAVKGFDPEKKISASDWETLEEAIRLSASSSGLQPWHFYVVTEPEIRKRLREVSHDQKQITDSSHLVVFAANENLDVAHIDKVIDRMVEVRGVTKESLAKFRESRIAEFTNRDSQVAAAWASNQVYIALGVFLTSCAMLEIDACPMEGFEPKKYDEILGIAKDGYASHVIAAAGYRSPSDKYGTVKKARLTKEQLFTHFK